MVGLNGFLVNVNVRYMLSPVHLSSVVCLSVAFVHPTQAVKIFGNISTALGILATHWHPQKILRRSSHGNSSAGGVKHKRGSFHLTARTTLRWGDYPKIPLRNSVGGNWHRWAGFLAFLANVKLYAVARPSVCHLSATRYLHEAIVAAIGRATDRRDDRTV